MIIVDPVYVLVTDAVRRLCQRHIQEDKNRWRWHTAVLSNYKLHLVTKAGDPMTLDFTAYKKSLASMNKNTSQGQIYHFLRPFLLLSTRWPLVGLLESSGGQMRTFPLSTLLLFHRGSPSSCIVWRMNNRPIGGCISET
jgi:hypothetical protein